MGRSHSAAFKVMTEHQGTPCPWKSDVSRTIDTGIKKRALNAESAGKCPGADGPGACEAAPYTGIAQRFVRRALNPEMQGRHLLPVPSPYL